MKVWVLLVIFGNFTMDVEVFQTEKECLRAATVKEKQRANTMCIHGAFNVTKPIPMEKK